MCQLWNGCHAENCCNITTLGITPPPPHFQTYGSFYAISIYFWMSNCGMLLYLIVTVYAVCLRREFRR
jgi:hypothetical protein